MIDWVGVKVEGCTIGSWLTGQVQTFYLRCKYMNNKYCRLYPFSMNPTVSLKKSHLLYWVSQGIQCTYSDRIQYHIWTNVQQVVTSFHCKYIPSAAPLNQLILFYIHSFFTSNLSTHKKKWPTLEFSRCF